MTALTFLTRAALVCAAGFAATSASAMTTFYTDEAAFKAAYPIVQYRHFDPRAAGPVSSGGLADGLFFGGTGIRINTDAGTYLDAPDGFYIPRAPKAIGVNFGSMSGSAVSVFLDGVQVGEAAPDTGLGGTFFGLVADAPVYGANSQHLTFTSPGDVSVTSFYFGTNVPEPAAWAMMVAGFGLIGAMLRANDGRRALRAI